MNYITGSTASTGSDSDCGSLHGGVCVKQNFISTKDCNIAKEALEILVTCLQLRNELIGKYFLRNLHRKGECKRQSIIQII